jgi:hypothetical protein
MQIVQAVKHNTSRNNLEMMAMEEVIMNAARIPS